MEPKRDQREKKALQIAVGRFNKEGHLLRTYFRQ